MRVTHLSCQNTLYLVSIVAYLFWTLDKIVLVPTRMNPFRRESMEIRGNDSFGALFY